MSLYFMCCSFNVSVNVCLVYCVLDSVRELFGETIYNVFGCGCCFVYEVVVVPYVDELVAVTVMRGLLFVLHVCLLRECDSVELTAMQVCGMDEVC